MGAKSTTLTTTPGQTGTITTNPTEVSFKQEKKLFLSLYILALVFFVLGVILAFLVASWAKSIAPDVNQPDSTVDQKKRGTSLGYSAIVFNVFSLVFVLIFMTYAMVAVKRAGTKFAQPLAMGGMNAIPPLTQTQALTTVGGPQFT